MKQFANKEIDGAYQSWVGMRSRCNNTKDNHYEYYGGRGIFVCKEWDRFDQFLEDMGSRSLGLTLDRIDNSKGYHPSNCKWSTRQEQANNRRPMNVIGKSGHKYIMCQPNGSYFVKTPINGVRVTIGTFKTLNKAISERDKALENQK